MAVLITGASSGLGAALARVYAGDGIVLFLGGRNADRLKAVADDCRQLGAVAVYTKIIDVRDAGAVSLWIKESHEIDALEVVIANAGVSRLSDSLSSSDIEHAYDIFCVNVLGVVNTIGSALEFMKALGRGHLVVISSMISFMGSPYAPAYSASKVAVRMYAECLSGHLCGTGVHVTAVCPGFIDTPMTVGHKFAMPFIMSADDAAVLIKRKLCLKNKPVVFAFPKIMYLLIKLTSLLPVSLLNKLYKLFKAPSRER